MDDFELRLLTKEEVSSDTSLSVLRRSNAAFTVNTDLACLTGSIQNTNCSTYYSLQPNLEEEKFYFMHIEDYVEEEKKYDRIESVRPVLHFLNSSINKHHLFYDHHLPKYKYGEYPQFILNEYDSHDEEIIIELTEKLLDQTLKKTGKKYCFYYGQNGMLPSIRYGIEYFYNGKKYMPFTSCYGASNIVTLSNDEDICPYKIYWLKVEPITWLYDEDKDLLISEYALVSGVGFERVKKGNDYESTEMYEFLNTHMRKDFIPSRVVEEDKSSLLDGSDTLKKYVYKKYGKKG